jgi:hypothetical protein
MWLDGISPSSERDILELGGGAPTGTGGGSLLADVQSLQQKVKPSVECQAFRLLWQAECLPSWQQHFLTERIKEKQKKYLIEKIKKEEESRNQSDDFWERVKAK